MSRWPDPTERSPRAPRLRDGSAYPSLVFLALRIVISIAGVLFVGDHPIDPSAVGPGAPPARYTEVATSGVHDAIDGMQRWDAAWFRWIAAEGYGSGDDRAAFFPGYPLLIASTSLVTSLDGATASTVASNIAFGLSLVALSALTRFELRDAAAAKRTVVVFACLPTSFFFLAPLSEAPFLLAVILAFFWARTGRWGWRVAGTAFAACLMRSAGIALVIALVVEAVRQRPSDGPGRSARLGASATGLLAPVLYGVWWWTQGESPLQPLRAQAQWHRQLMVPPVTILNGLRAAWTVATSGVAIWLLVDAAILAVVLIAAVVAWRRLPSTYAAFVWASLLIPLSYPAPWRPLLSVPRFAAVLFPLAWVAEEGIRTRIGLGLLVTACLFCQIALAVEFMNWGWIY